MNSDIRFSVSVQNMLVIYEGSILYSAQMNYSTSAVYFSGNSNDFVGPV